MPRYFLKVEFDGSPFVGWQRQDNGPSVQGALEAAGEAFAGAKTPVYGAGRTDSGVHGLGMVAHIDLPKEYEAYRILGALNAHLREVPVSVLAAWQVPDDAHARYHCQGRSYLYRIISRRAPLALDGGRAWRLPQDLDVAGMREGAKAMIGKYDFTTFRSSQCQADSPVKTLDSIEIETKDEETRLTVSAPSFLHNQVRSIVGTLVEVGLGRWNPSDVSDALLSKDRTRCGPVAPAHGLYFLSAKYPAALENPANQ